LVGAYTYSKVLANVRRSRHGSTQELVSQAYQNVFNLQGEKALSSFDSHERLTVSYVYDLPMGRGKHFFSSLNGFRRPDRSVWGINGLTTFPRGFPLGSDGYP